MNLFTGHAGVETLIQVRYAIAFEYIMVFVFYKGGSLLPCIISHSLVDVFSKIGEVHGTYKNQLTYRKNRSIVHKVNCLLCKLYFVLQESAEEKSNDTDHIRFRF